MAKKIQMPRSAGYYAGYTGCFFRRTPRLFGCCGQLRYKSIWTRAGRNIDIENIASIDTTVIVNGYERTIRVFNVDWINRYQTLMNIENWRFIDEEQQNPFCENPRLRYPHFNWEGN